MHRRGTRTLLPARRLAAIGAVSMALGAAGGCASILGFEDTTLRTGNEEAGNPIDSSLPDGSSPSEGGASLLTATPASLIVRRGATADLAVALTRGADSTGAVTVRVSDLPAGVTATSATLAATTTTGTLTLDAAKSAALGPATLKLTADGTTLPPVLVPLLVADGAGTLDTTFNTSGLVSDVTKGLAETYNALAVQSDGQLLAGGNGAAGPAGPTTGWVVRRYSATGALDGAFTTAFNAAAAAALADGQLRGMALDKTGRIVCVGASSQPTAFLTVARLLPTGALDTTFGGGVVRFGIGEGILGSSGLGVSVQPDDSIVVVGSRRDVGNNEAGVIARWKTNGTRDPAFNGGAVVFIPGTRLVGIALEASGALVIGGSTIAGALPSFFLTRRTALGANDPTFATAGTAAFGNTYQANAFARLADGSFALVGEVQQGAEAYTAGVASAKGDAVFARAFAAAPNAGFFGLAEQGDARLVAAGHTTTANGEARVERFFADGGKDLSFSDGGTSILEPGGVANGLDVTLFATAVQKDGRILVAGNRSNAGAVVYRLWP